LGCKQRNVVFHQDYLNRAKAFRLTVNAKSLIQL
jgi:hypothetical protein